MFRHPAKVYRARLQTIEPAIKSYTSRQYFQLMRPIRLSDRMCIECSRKYLARTPSDNRIRLSDPTIVQKNLTCSIPALKSKQNHTTYSVTTKRADTTVSEDRDGVHKDHKIITIDQYVNKRIHLYKITPKGLDKYLTDKLVKILVQRITNRWHCLQVEMCMQFVKSLSQCYNFISRFGDKS